MMKSLNILVRLSAAFLMLLMTGCVKEVFPAQSDDVVLNLTLMTPAIPGTKAMYDTEYLIKDVRVLLFDNTERLIGEIPSMKMDVTSPGDVSEVKITLDKSYVGSNLYFMLLANMGDNVTAPLDLTAGRTKSAIINDISFAQDGVWPLDDSRTFPMYGIVSQVLSNGIINKDVYMLRSLSRIQFWVNDGLGVTYNNGGVQEELFRMSSVRVYFSRMGGYIAPLVPFTNSDSYITSPSHPEDFGQRSITNPLVFDVQDTDKYEFLNSIYIPESNNTTSADRPVTIVVGGHYKGSPVETFYKVEFKDATTSESFDCLRNYTYDFNITTATAPGKNTPEEALGTESNLSVKITPWSEASVAAAQLYIYELSVSTSMLTVDFNEHTEVIDVATTYTGDPSPKHWYYTGHANDAGNESGWFTVTEVGNTLSVHINQNASTADRLGSFTISSGVLTKRIYISQNQRKTSNCYLVDEPGLHGLYALNMGNGEYGATVDGSSVSLAANLASGYPAAYNDNGTINKSVVKKCRLIWQSRSGLITHVGPEGYVYGDPVDVLTEAGMLAYTVGDPLAGETGGNAVIGIFDESDNCLWSWHIWVIWGYDSEAHDLHFLTSGVTSGFFFQDRNLGATKDVKGTAESYGLLYQWGRKDPMRSTGNINTPYVFTPTYAMDGSDNSSEWHNWTDGTNCNTILKSVQNPMSLAAGWGAETPAGAWGNPKGATMIGGAKTSNTDLTTARYNGTQVYNEGKKSIYDPCPVGYRVPSINGFYFGIGGASANCVQDKNTGLSTNIYSYCDLDAPGTEATGYLIYYFGQYKNYEKYYTWMPMTPYYLGGNPNTLISPKEGSEGFAYTWLNCPGGKGTGGQTLGWHPVNYHIHAYANYTADVNNGGTVRCVRETDPDLVTATLADKVALLADAGSTMEFGVLSNLAWDVETNNMTYEWVTAIADPVNSTITVKSLTPNLTAEDRTAYIYVTFANGDKKAVKVIQSGVSIGADELFLSYDQNSTKSVTFPIPTGGSLSLPYSSDTYFNYTLTNTGQTYTLTATAKTANDTPVDRTASINLILSDGLHNNEMPVQMRQSKYTIGDGTIKVPFYSATPKGTVSFVLPGGMTGTPEIYIGGSPAAQDDRFTYALSSATNKGITTWTLTATYKYTCFGYGRKRAIQVKIGSSFYDVIVEQAFGTALSTTEAAVSNAASQTVKPTMTTAMQNSVSGYTWKVKDAGELPSWITVTDTYLSATSTKLDGKLVVATTSAANFTGEERLATIEFEFTNKSTGEQFVEELAVVQAAGSALNASSVSTSNKANQSVSITWSNAWKNLASNKYNWTIVNATEAPSWLDLTTTSGTNVNNIGSVVVGKTALANGTGAARSWDMEIRFTSVSDPEDTWTLMFTITQSK